MSYDFDLLDRFIEVMRYLECIKNCNFLTRIDSFSYNFYSCWPYESFIDPELLVNYAECTFSQYGSVINDDKSVSPDAERAASWPSRVEGEM